MIALFPSRRVLRAAFPAILLLLAAPGAQAQVRPSFDCGRAVTQTEFAICASDDLAQLDVALSRAYARSRAGLVGAARIRLREQQRAWLTRRDRCRGGAACLAEQMSARIAALSDGTPVRPAVVAGGSATEVQRALIALGFLKGRADGIVGPQTLQAIRAFLASRGRPVVSGREVADAAALLAAPPAAAVPASPSAVATAPAAPSSPSTPPEIMSPTEPLGIDTVAGDWIRVGVGFRGNGFRPTEVSRNIARTTLRIFRTGPASVSVAPASSGSGAAAGFEQDTDEEGFLLRYERGGRPANGIPYRLERMRSRSGVDILQGNSGGTYLIRFRPTEAALSYGAVGFDDFCSGPGRALAEAARREIDAAEEYPAWTAEGEPARIAALHGVFGGPAFAKAFGRAIGDMQNPARTEIVERLRTCAIFHPNRAIGDPLATALFGDALTTAALRADLQQTTRARDARPLEVRSSAGRAYGLVSRAGIERDNLSRGLAEVAASEMPDRTRQARIAALVRAAAPHLPPSETGARLTRVAVAQARADREAARAAQAEADRTAAPRPEGDLVLDAARDYFLANCNKAVLTMRAVNAGSGVVTTVLARRIEPQGGQCTVVLATHILRFIPRAVRLQGCSGSDPADCRFDLFWACSYDLNPAFGFSSGLANFDPICPVIELAPVPMTGRFRRAAPGRWVALAIDY